MSFIDKIFGRSAPTTETASAALARVEKELAAAPSRLAKAEAALKDVAGMADAEHAAVIAERDAASRSAARLEQQAAQLRIALADAGKTEAAATLAARAKTARAKLAAYSGLIDRHDAQAIALSATLADMAEAEAEIAACNSAIDAAHRAGLQVPEKVETPDARYRAEADVVTPETRVFEDKVVYTETKIHYGPNDEELRTHRDVPVGTTVTKDGKIVLRAGERLAKVERTIPASTKYGRRCCSPTTETVLAPARIGQAGFWPKPV